MKVSGASSVTTHYQSSSDVALTLDNIKNTKNQKKNGKIPSHLRTDEDNMYMYNVDGNVDYDCLC